jgi:hypothetical protein
MKSIQKLTQQIRSQIFKILEEDHPKYSSSDQIAYALDLDQILQGDIQGSKIDLYKKFEQQAKENDPGLENSQLINKTIQLINEELDLTLQKLLAEI